VLAQPALNKAGPTSCWASAITVALQPNMQSLGCVVFTPVHATICMLQLSFGLAHLADLRSIWVSCIAS
jgi:hypothetical protein